MISKIISTENKQRTKVVAQSLLKWINDILDDDVILEESVNES